MYEHDVLTDSGIFARDSLADGAGSDLESAADLFGKIHFGYINTFKQRRWHIVTIVAHGITRVARRKRHCAWQS